MSQAPLVFTQTTGQQFIDFVEAATQANVSFNSGATEPTVMYAFQYWADTATNTLKQRNSGNTAWQLIDTTNVNKVVAKAVAFNLGIADINTMFICTGTTYTITFTVAATLTSRWRAMVLNNATGNLILDPSGAETINGATTKIIKPGAHNFVWCDGTAFHATGGHIDSISEGDVIALAVAL